jgi:hypothetical protein
VYRSRVPATRFNSVSRVCATRAQIVGATLRVFGPQRQRDDRHVVDALGLDDGLADPKVGRQPVAIGIELVVQADDGVGAGLADQELHGQHRHAGP